MSHRAALPAVAAAALLLAAPAAADAVLDWNQVTLDTIRIERPSPPVAARALALVHVAVFDAVNGIVGGHEPYHVTDTRAGGSLRPGGGRGGGARRPDGALPGARGGLRRRPRRLAGRRPRRARRGGRRELGSRGGRSAPGAAGRRRRERGHSVRNSGRRRLVDSDAARLRPGALAQLAARAAVGDDDSGSQFRQAAPPSPNTDEYTLAFHEVRRLGRVDSALRTAEQTEIALFWADGPGTVTPPGHWFVIAQDALRVARPRPGRERAPVRAPGDHRGRRRHRLLGHQVHLQPLAAGDRHPARRHRRQPRHRRRPRLDVAHRDAALSRLQLGPQHVQRLGRPPAGALLRHRRDRLRCRLGRPAGRGALVHSPVRCRRRGRTEPHLRRHPLALRQHGRPGERAAAGGPRVLQPARRARRAGRLRARARRCSA